MDITFTYGHKQAFDRVTAASQEGETDPLDFQTVVAPALQYARRKPAEVGREWALYSLNQISEEVSDSVDVTAYLVFLKEQGVLQQKSSLDLIFDLLGHKKEKLALRLCAMLGIPLEQIVTFAAQCDAVQILKAYQEKGEKLTPQLLATAVDRSASKGIAFLLDQGMRLDLDLIRFVPSGDVLDTLVQHGFDINTQDKQGNTLLHRAIQEQDNVAVSEILAHRPNISLQNREKRTALEEGLQLIQNSSKSYDAFLICSLEIYAYAVKTGALKALSQTAISLFNYYTNLLDTALVLKRLSPDTIELFQKAEKEFRLRKIVGHSHSLQNSKVFQYEALANSFQYNTLMEGTIAESLCLLPEESGLSATEKEALETAFSNAVSFDQAFQSTGEMSEALTKIRNGELVILATGHKGHHIDIVFYKNLFIICNRGAGNHEHHIEAYAIDPQKMNESILRDLYVTQSGGSWISQALEKYYRKNRLYIDIAGRLSPTGKPLQDAFCRKLAAISPKDQTVGNCPFASPKTAFRAALAVMRANPKDATTWDQVERAREDSKKTFTFLRMEFLEQYLNLHATPQRVPQDPELVGLAVNKLKSHLKRVVSPAHRYPHLVQVLTEKGIPLHLETAS